MQMLLRMHRIEYCTFSIAASHESRHVAIIFFVYHLFACLLPATKPNAFLLRWKIALFFSCPFDAQLVSNSIFFFCREKNLIHNNRKNGAQLYDADNELNTYFCVSMSTFQDLHDPESTGWDCNVCHGLWSSDVLCHSTKFSARKIIMLRWVMRIIMP